MSTHTMILIRLYIYLKNLERIEKKKKIEYFHEISFLSLFRVTRMRFLCFMFKSMCSIQLIEKPIYLLGFTKYCFFSFVQMIISSFNLLLALGIYFFLNISNFVGNFCCCFVLIYCFITRVCVLLPLSRIVEKKERTFCELQIREFLNKCF